MEEAWAEFLVDRDARSISPDQESKYYVLLI